MRIIDDLQRLIRTPRALTAAVVFVAAAAAAIAVFPEQPVSAAASDRGETEQAAAGARPSRRRRSSQQFEQYLAQQPRVPVMAPSDGAAVVILKFNDYQCPACGQTYRDYKPMLAKWAKQAPGQGEVHRQGLPARARVQPVRRPGPASAARARRRSRCGCAREKGKAEAMEDWLYANQPAMTPDTVKKAARDRRRRHRFRRAYPATLELVKADVAQGQQLADQRHADVLHQRHRLPGLRAEYFDAAIAWELKRLQSGGK